MRFIRFLLEISWRSIVIAASVGFVSGCGNSLLIALVNRSIHESSVPNALLYFAGLAIFTLLTSVTSQFMLIHLAQGAIYELRLKLSRNILSAPLQHLEQLGESRLLMTLTDDIRVLSHAVSVIPNLFIDLATVAGCLVYLAWLSSTIFALTVGISAIAIWGVQTKVNQARSLFTVARDEEDHLLQHFQTITHGTKELKLHRARREDFISKNVQSSASKLRQKNSKAMKSFAVANGLGQSSQFFTMGFVLFVLPLFLHVPLPMLSTYVLTSTFISMPMQSLLNRLPDIMRGNVALRKIERLRLSLTSQLEHESMPTFKVNSHCQVELDQVTYLYQPEREEEGPQLHHPRGDRPISSRLVTPPPMIEERGFFLGAITLSFKPGEVTYIVGGNGSGKSTLAKLIAGLYTPHDGAIYLNGVRITNHNREWYRQHFSAIFSDFHLFDSCLGFNRPNLDEEIEMYLQQLRLDHKVQVKNGILSTTRLSQGQRKRLALLTAYLEDRPIYLFDEWASDQEPLFRELFYKEILVKLKQQGKTVIVITHDDRYFHLADHIVKLDYGKIELDEKPLSIGHKA
ncbi:cyclic peptide export ABC transporter [Leptolyngbya sp. DQ-M1]|uniref:cyclic peptide export ABC transporter n=1 Tax=Leptolyngbya sp. DQ-M1 TaxID=2933920 RepID=UPI003298A239